MINSLSPFFNNVNIPENKILLLHVRLQRLKSVFELSYLQLTQQLIQGFRQFNPKMILVPSYTFSYMKSGVYHREHSRAEVGRFSEEVRKNILHYRTPDPIYSLMDLDFILNKREDIQYLNTYAENSLFKNIYDEDYLIINVDLDGTVATQFHFTEGLIGTDYRFKKKYPGVLYWDDQKHESIVYETCARSVDVQGVAYPQYNRSKIKSYLQKEGVANSTCYKDCELVWMSSQEFTTCLFNKLNSDSHFLVS